MESKEAQNAAQAVEEEEQQGISTREQNRPGGGDPGVPSGNDVGKHQEQGPRRPQEPPDRCSLCFGRQTISGEARLKIKVVPTCRLCLIFRQLSGEKSSTVHHGAII
jgi:hypothetical protein